MDKTVTVNEALKKGRAKLVHLPTMIIVGTISLGLLLFYLEIIPGWSISITFIVGFLSGWLVWSYLVNKWKIWAFENVRNVHELEQKVIEEKLIWQSGSWFEKTEFKSEEQKLKLKLLERKFLEKDIFTDDTTVPEETIIYYSTITLITKLSIYLSSLSAITYYFFESIWMIIISSAIGFYLIYDLTKKLRDKKPQIIINTQGIQLKNKKLVPWNKVRHDSISGNYLVFNNEEIDVEDFNIKNHELENALHVYRVRFEKTILKLSQTSLFQHQK